MARTVLERSVYRLSGKKGKTQALGVCLPKSILNLWGWVPKTPIELVINDETKEILIRKHKQ